MEISGGRRITGWQPAPEMPGIWKTRVALPQSPDDNSWRFEQLWVNGQRAVRARTPNDWEFFFLASNVAEEGVSGEQNRLKHTFTTRPGALQSLMNLPER